MATRKKGAMTAHPKIDPLTGELHGFGYMTDHFGSNTMTYHVIDKSGKTFCCSGQTFLRPAPYAGMVHDFVITRDYVLFPIFPLTCDMSRIAKFGFPFAFDSAAGAFIGVLKRGAPVSEIRWLEAPVCYVYHYLNAWNEGDRVTFDSIDFPMVRPHNKPRISKVADKWIVCGREPNFPTVEGNLPAHADAQGKLHTLERRREYGRD